MNKHKILFIITFLILVVALIQPLHSKRVCLTILFTSLNAIVLLFFLIKKRVLYCAFGFAIFLFAIPWVAQRKIEEKTINEMYVKELTFYVNTNYVWGGEGFLGIDCSGLPRSAMIKALYKYGIYYFNGKALTYATNLWWNDASAKEMLSGYKGKLQVEEAEYTINSAPPNRQAGDLAITATGLHVMVYLDNKTIIQSDPVREKVVIDNLPSSSMWYEQKVKCAKWIFNK